MTEVDISVSLGVHGYQVAIVCDYNDNSRMFPLLPDDSPLCLLPVANRRILAYQLDSLVASGIKEAFLIAPTEYCNALTMFLNQYGRDSIAIDLIPIIEMSGTVDALKILSDRIHSDVIVLGSDFISQHLLDTIANLHREKSADVTVLFATPPLEERESGNKVTLKTSKIDEVDQEFVGICDDNRLVIKTPGYEIEEAFKLNKYLLHKCVSLTLRHDVMDVGCYVFSKWIFTYLKTTTRFSNIRTELLPYLVNRQFQKFEYLMECFPALSVRKQPLQDLQERLYEVDSVHIDENGNTNGNNMNRNKAFLNRLSSFSSMSDVQNTTGNHNNSSIHNHENDGDILKCFAITKEPTREGTVQETGVCRRVTSLQSYMNLNRDLLNGGIPPSAPWPRLQGYQKKECSVLGENSNLGDKVTIKQCSIGRDCTIGAKSKLNNCIIMDGVNIGESCTIQNSIICVDVVIENNCNINECQIGMKYHVAAGSKFKGEPLN